MKVVLDMIWTGEFIIFVFILRCTLIEPVDTLESFLIMTFDESVNKTNL